MHAEAVDEGDILAGDAGGLQLLQQDRQDDVVGRRAGDVGEDDGDGIVRPYQLGQGPRAYRVGQGLADSFAWVGERGQPFR